MGKKKHADIQGQDPTIEENEPMPSRDDEKQRTTDYDKLLAKVRVAKEMTDTEGWGAMYAGIQAQIKSHSAAVLDAEKPREIVQHQEGVKILRDVLSWPQKSVLELQNYVNSWPLFAGQFRVRAEWNEGTGKIVLKEMRG